MNLSTPILISHTSAAFRSLLKEMLIKHGFFHLMEAAGTKDTLELFASEKPHFTLIETTLLTPEVTSLMNGSKDFLIIGNTQEATVIKLIARLGVKHFLSFPFSSSDLVKKMTDLSQ
jgi:response regulator RpfG family c-di-GMP phosphodiesterase